VGPGSGARDAGRSKARLTAAITAVALLVLGGSFAAWVTLGHHASSAAAAAPGPSIPVRSIPDPPTADQVPFGASATPTAGSSVLSTDAAASAGSTAVSLAADAADSPSAAQVQDLLTRHFSAINDLDYAAWVATVTPARAKDQTQDAWLQGYRSSRDSNVTITAIDPVDPQTVTVHISFVSAQDPQDAPADLQVGRICWTQQIPVEGVGTDPRLGLPPKGSSTKSAC
jgi:hypothetical protein